MYDYLNKFYSILKNLSETNIWPKILKPNSQFIIILNQNSVFINFTDKNFFNEK